ncbi:MAG: uvrABC system protein [Chloroflexota bacterium]|nr:MAG: excinuclease ABC subunit UvrC [Chloroflexota bacterium]
MDLSEKLQGQLANLPAQPGCYLMKDAGGVVIYVGKAINLRNRVRSYFHASSDHSGKTRELVRRVVDIEWIIQNSELEALLLEYNLINRHQPRYNVRWKDGKAYPYIKVHWQDAFPKVTVTRRVDTDGARYFGPYTSSWAVHQTLDVLRKLFPYLTCDRDITGTDARACLYADIHLCMAPCIGSATQEQYRAMAADLSRFLQGETAQVVERLRVEMGSASEKLHFERAATLRDQLLAIERVVEKQKVISQQHLDSDVIAFARQDNDACAQVFFVRGGKLIGRDHFLLEGVAEENDTEVLGAFLKQFYHKATHIPAEVLLPAAVAEATIIERWLRDKRNGQKVSLVVPQRGDKRKLVQMALENATETLGGLRAQWQADTHKQEAALAELQAGLELAAPPTRIECFDISNTQGTAATGSMVVFHQGTPAKSHYRRFVIRSVAGPDDYASMREVLTRRLQRWQDLHAAQHAPGHKPDESFLRLPELLIVDGGKGQLGVAVEVLQAFGLSGQVALASLAKQNEELFVPGRAAPIMLPRRSPGLFLVQRIRDEAHRFALTLHRARRTRTGLASQLDAIPGIGPARRKALLKHFGSIDGIRSAELEDLAQVRGVSRDVARAVKDVLA